MQKIILMLLMAAAITGTAIGQRTQHHMEVHETGTSDIDMEIDRTPIQLPIVVYYDSDTNILEVWCDNDNIQGEIYVYDESGAVEAYSPYMNVELTLTTSGGHSILIDGDGWVAEGNI